MRRLLAWLLTAILLGDPIAQDRSRVIDLEASPAETIGLLTMPADAEFASAPPPTIELWHGREQHFGEPGVAQRWVNVLGSVRADAPLAALTYSLNGAAARPSTVGPDNYRLASLGDFNVELATNNLRLSAGQPALNEPAEVPLPRT